MAVLSIPKTLFWKDFGKPVTAVPASYQGSHTDCHIGIDISFTHGGTIPDGTTGDFKLKDVKVTVKLDALDTWVLDSVPKSATQAATLKHEQGHFNIAAVAAKELEAALKALRNADAGTLVTDADDALASALSDGQTEEDTYDSDPVDGGTDHGNDLTQQAKWNGLIAKAKSLADLP